MKTKLMCVVMACCLMGALQADLVITSGDFETTALGGLDIADWYDMNTAEGATAWWTTTSEGNSKDPFNGSACVMLGDGNGSTGGATGAGGRWIYQQIGTKEDGINYYQISLDYGQPTDGRTARAVGIQIDNYAGIFDGAADDVDIANAGLTWMGTVSTPTTSEVGAGVYTSFTGTLDVSGAAAGEAVWIRLSNLPGAGSDVGSWVVIDNVELGSLTLPMSYHSPVNGADDIPVELAAGGNDLVFTINDPNIVEVDVQFGTEDDPNLTMLPAFTLDHFSVSPGMYSVNLESLAANLTYAETYYWKVIGYEPNAVSSLNDIVVPGPVWIFTAVPAEASINIVEPAYTTVDAGGNVVLTTTGTGIDTYQWYKIGNPDLQLVNGADYSGVDTDTLTILDVQESDEGYYYCIGSNGVPSESSNRDTGPGRVMTKRLIVHYPLDIYTVVDSNSITPDVVSGYDMKLASYSLGAGDGLDFPSVVAGVPELGGSALMFNNSDSSNPNSAWGQYAVTEAIDLGESGGGITISFWMNWAENSGTFRQSPVSRRNSWAVNDMMWTVSLIDTTNSLYLASYPNWTGNTEVGAKSQWTYVTVTFDGLSESKIYVNGELQLTSSAITAYTGGVNSPILLGTEQVGGSEYFYGTLDDVKIYNYARTTEQIAQDYLAVRGDWVCNNELNALLYDFSGNCRVDLSDFAIFAATWLDSNRIYPSAP